MVLTDDAELAGRALEPAQPGPLRRRRLAGPLAPRLQLPPLRRPLARSAWPSSSGSPTCWPPAPGWPAWYQARDGARSTASPRCTRGRSERSWFVYAPRLDPDLDRDEVIGDLDARGRLGEALPALHPPPAVLPEAHGHGPGEFPVTEAISASTIALPFFPEMTEEQVDRVCARRCREAVGPGAAGRPAGAAGR